MDEDLEDELLMHIAAGTDIPTALAALPQDEPPAGRAQQQNWTVWAVLVGFVIVLWLLAG